MTLKEFRAGEELNKALGFNLPLQTRLVHIDRHIRDCEKNLRDKFKPKGHFEAEPTGADIVAAILNRKSNDRSEFGTLTQDMEDWELIEVETVGTFLTLIDFYIQRGRLRRELVRQTETSAAQVELWRENDHYMMEALEGTQQGTLARLLARHGYDYDPGVKTGQEAPETEITAKAVDEKDKGAKGD
ncbi:hypothetical protein E8E13_003199 [Curvularia kusanoi]|uniref:Uncharacterized protein n=1 Tax=Curvularia kusanoi TaxID=90978 RepID=A0A9P4T466_CURKU|nr:hypothetical protein E8E13_003199 [Curvularia kusanoi]